MKQKQFEENEKNRVYNNVFQRFVHCNFKTETEDELRFNRQTETSFKFL
jgi:hypothetical protein